MFVITIPNCFVLLFYVMLCFDLFCLFWFGLVWFDFLFFMCSFVLKMTKKYNINFKYLLFLQLNLVHSCSNSTQIPNFAQFLFLGANNKVHTMTFTNGFHRWCANFVLLAKIGVFAQKSIQTTKLSNLHKTAICCWKL